MPTTTRKPTARKSARKTVRKTVRKSAPAPAAPTTPLPPLNIALRWLRLTGDDPLTGYRYAYDHATGYLTIGCQVHSLADWREHGAAYVREHFDPSLYDSFECSDTSGCRVCKGRQFVRAALGITASAAEVSRDAELSERVRRGGRALVTARLNALIARIEGAITLTTAEIG